MLQWDVFLSERLEVLRGLTTDEVRAGLTRGEFRDDDLVRPAGSSDPWGRLADLPDLAAPLPEPEPEPEPEPDPTQTQARVTPPPSEPDDESDDWTVQDAGRFPAIGRDPEPPPEPEPTYAAGELSPIIDDDDDDHVDESLDSAGHTRFAPEAESAALEFAIDDDEDEDDGQTHRGDESTIAASGPGADSLFALIDEDDDDEPQTEPAPPGAVTQPAPRTRSDSRLALPVEDDELAAWQGEIPPDSLELEFEPDGEPGFETEPEPLDDDEDAAAFTLNPEGAEPLEELDLTAMVDVAFQLILFFLVTATSMYFKTLEVPKPNPDRPEIATQQARTVEELEEDFILVNIDPKGAFTIDREPVSPTLASLSDRLKAARRDTGRTAMLLTADATTLHRYAVLAYDAANEIGLSIAIARPSSVARDAADGGE